MVKRTPPSPDHKSLKKPPAVSPNPTEKKRSRGENGDDKGQEIMEIEDSGDPKQDLAGRFEALAMPPALNDSLAAMTVYNLRLENKKPPTPLFLSQPDPVREKAKPYKPKDVLPSAETDSAEIHDMTLIGRTEICRQANLSVTIPVTISQWTKLFEASFKSTGLNDRKMRSFALRLSKTSPEIFGDLWEQDFLAARDDTRAWKAAYNLFGASWQLRKKIQFAAPNGPSRVRANINPTETPNVSHKAFASDSHSQTPSNIQTSARGLFLRKETPTDRRQTNLNEIPRRYKTIMTAKSSKLNNDGAAGDAEAVGIIHEMLSELKKIDPRLVLHPWNPQDKDNRPTTKFLEITQKSVLSKYTDKLWIRTGQNFYIRFEVGHDVDRLQLESDELKKAMRNRDCYLFPDQVQDRKVVCAGWFLGSYPKTFNPSEFLPALQAHPLIGGRDLKTRIQDFRLYRTSPYSHKIPAVHLFCRQSEARTIRAALNRIYGSEKNGGLPAGRNMKFIPSTTEPSLPPTGNMIQQAKIAAAKQKRFLVCMTHTLTDIILDMDVYVAEPVNATLREIIMCLKTADGDSNMFAAVDTMWDSKVALVHHGDYESEVLAIVPFFPLILEARFDASVWIWFVPEQKDISAGFYWDPISGTVRSSEDDHLSAAIAAFDEYEPFELFEDQGEDDLASATETGPPRFDLELQINLEAQQDSLPIYQMGAGSVGTFRQALHSSAKTVSVSTDTSMTDTSTLTHDSSNNSRHQNDIFYAATEFTE